MKRKIMGLVLALALLASCAAPAAESSTPAPSGNVPEMPQGEAVTADAVAQAILETQPDPSGYEAQTGEDLELYLTLYGVEDYFLKEAAVYAAAGVDGREIAVLRLDSMNSDFSAITAALEEYRQNRAADFFGYAPEQAALIEEGVVTGGWGCVALLLCEDMDHALAAFETAAGGGETPESAETPGEETTPSPEQSAALPDPTPEPTPELTAEDTRWFIPFDPPNEVDMTLYDTSAILAAWETGDREGLSEKDAAILTAAAEAMAGLPEGISDYAKELTLHDWLLDRASYDRSVHDPHTPEGRENNRDPYGPLVNGYGICLGYATSFQLLMDLAGVECITVVGASKESREDHAWNMVKLAGEWYCVDPTWNDTNNDPDEGARHRYFNCTSAYMRQSNHQWDYQAVPEATAEDWGAAAIYPGERLP